MRFEDMKKEIPETPEFIHEMIQNEVEKQMHSTKVVNIHKKKKWNIPKAAAVVAVCTLAVSSMAYAGVNLYHMYLEKQGTYGIQTVIKTDDGKGTITHPNELHELDLFARYIPEGMKWTDDYHLQYPENEQGGGFSFSFALLDQKDLGQAIQDTSVIDSEERTFGIYEGIYLKYNSLVNDGSFNQRIYLLCPKLYRALILYIGDDVSKEDAVKVAENLVLTENDNIFDSSELPSFSEVLAPGTEENSEEMLTSIESSKLPVYPIGDSFNLDVSGEDETGNSLDTVISACVDSVQLADDIQLLDPDKVPEKWKNLTNGSLPTNMLSYVKNGDGINSVDEIVKSEEVKQKLVYVTVTYTNHSDMEINHMLYLGTLITMEKDDGIYKIYDSRELSGDGYDRIVWDGAADTGEMVYSSVSENYGNGRNYISCLKPGESIQVNMAWIVNETDLGNLYLNLNGDGGMYDFTEPMQKNGVVDIHR